MQGPTHRQGGIVAALGAFSVLEFQGLLIEDVHPLLQLITLYPFAYYGSSWPDLDHHKGSIPSRDPFSMIQWHILHIGRKFKPLEFTVPHHRSIQTHSDLTLVLSLLATLWFSGGFSILSGSEMTPNELLIRLIGAGLSAGVLAHLFLDAITPEGIWSIPLYMLKKTSLFKWVSPKFSFVPPKSYFATGNSWESKVVNPALKVISWLLILWVVIRLFFWEEFVSLIEYLVGLIKYLVGLFI